jgi:hypothetical protein
MCSGLSRRVLSSRRDRTRFPGQKRNPYRPRQQIRADAAYGDSPSWSSVKTLVRDRVNIVCLPPDPTPSDTAWRSFATRWACGSGSTRAFPRRTDIYDRPASGRRHTAVVRPDHADVSPRGNPPYSIAPYSSALTVDRTRRICIRWLRPFTRCSRTSQTTRAVPHATYSRFGRCVRRQRQWTPGRCRRHRRRLVKSGR